MMYFIANTARQGGRLPTAYGPYSTKEEAQMWAGKMPPGEYVVYGPTEAVQAVIVAKPIVTSKPMTV